jgi:DNA-directed RNA polymerase subunit RPC12/RpoP
MILRFICPTCGQPGRLDTFQGREWQCPKCDHLLHVPKPVTNEAGDEFLTACPVCGNGELYKKKGFPHWLGLSILTVACLAFLLLHNWYLPYWAWAVLLGSALFDGVLYVCVADVIVCYRCGSHVSGVQSTEANKPYELVIAERYRQARIRKEQKSNVRSV